MDDLERVLEYLQKASRFNIGVTGLGIGRIEVPDGRYLDLGQSS